MATQELIKQRREYRNKVLCAAYELAAANADRAFDRAGLAVKVGLGEATLDDAIEYLVGERFFKVVYQTMHIVTYKLTHEGNREAERLLG